MPSCTTSGRPWRWTSRAPNSPNSKRGLITPADLREADGTALGSITPRQLDDAAAGRWEFDVRTSPSEYGNLSLVELTITEASDDPAVDPESLVSYTIRQLIELRPDDDETYEEDDLLRGLPAP
jgi:hypothetical protein